MLLFARRAASKRSIRDHPRNGSNVGRRGWRQFEALRNIRGVVPSRRFSPMDRSTQQRLRRRPSGQTLVEVSEPPAVIDKKNSGSAEGYELLTAQKFSEFTINRSRSTQRYSRQQPQLRYLLSSV